MVPIIKWNIFSASLPQIEVNFTLEQNTNFSFQELLRRTFNSLKYSPTQPNRVLYLFLYLKSNIEKMSFLRFVFITDKIYARFSLLLRISLIKIYQFGNVLEAGKGFYKELYKIKIIIVVLNKTFMLKTIL